MARAYQRLYAVAVRIPRGRVVTYGQLARLAGLGGAARLAGYAMHAIGKLVPWQRVLGQRHKGVGHITIKDPIGAAEQRRLLEKEGVRFSADGAVDLLRHGWRPKK